MINKIKLGSSSLEVSSICLGTMTFGEQNSEAKAHSQPDWARAASTSSIWRKR